MVRDGRHALDATAGAAKVTEWIKCSDRMPDVGQTIRLRRDGLELEFKHEASDSFLPDDEWQPVTDTNSREFKRRYYGIES